MLRFLLVPLFVIQLFMMFGYFSGDSNFSDVRAGWAPNGGTAGSTSEDTDASPGWDPNGTDAGPGWDPDG